MALQKQTLPVNLTDGLDTKTDPKTMLPGSLTDLENCEIIKANRFKKRAGHTEEPAIDLSGAALTGGEGLATHDDDQLLRIKDGTLYARSDSGSRWVEKGYVSRVDTKVYEAASRYSDTPSQESEYIEHAELNGFALFGYGNSNDGGRIVVFDMASGVEVASVSGSAFYKFKCCTLGNRIYIVYYNNTLLRIRYFDTSSPTAISSGLTIVSASGGDFDVIGDEGNNQVLVAFSRASNPQIEFYWRDSNGSAVSNATVTASATGSGDDIEQIKLYQGSANQWYCVYYAGVDDTLKYLVVADNLTVTKAATTIDTIGGFDCLAGGYYDGSDLQVFHSQRNNSSSLSHQLMQATVDTSGVVSASTNKKYHLVPFSDAFLYDGNIYIFAATQSESSSDFEPTQVHGTLFLYDVTNDRIEAKFFEDSVFNFHDNEVNATKKVANPSSGVYRVVCETLGADTFSWTTKIAEVNFNKEQYHYVQHGDETIFAGGVVRSYDGAQISELGFIQQCRLLGDVTENTTGGQLSDSVYQYAVVPQWSDNNGNIVRGTPFLFTADHTGSATSTNQTAGIKIQTLGVTDKSDVQIVIYRTEGNGTVFYRWGEFDNDANLSDGYISSTAGFSDNTSDSDLVSLAEDILYTNGGVLENVAPPAAERVAIFKDRLFLSKMHDKGKVWYSHAVEDGEPTRTSDSLTMNISYRGQQVEGLGVVDDKLIALMRNRYYYTYGDGPNTTGFGGTFAPFELASNDTGVEDGKSIVETPDGLMYRSAKGIYLIDSSLNSTYIGAQVEDIIDGQTISSAVVVPQKNRVRFTTLAGDMVEYDFFFRKWYTQTGLDAYDAVFLGNEYYLLRNTGGLVFKEDGTVFADDGTDYLMKLETGWISLANLVGFQRIYSLFFVGERKDACSFKVSVAYDHSDTYDHSTTIVLNTALDNGAGGYYPFRLEVPTKVQKCQAFRVKIEEVSPSTSDESFTLTGMGIKFGVKRGFAKLRSTQTSGVS